MSKAIIEIDQRQAGQPRSYADGVLTNGAQFYSELNEQIVYGLTQMFVHEFTTTPQHAFAPRLTVCEAVGPTPEMCALAGPQWVPGKLSRWHVVVMLPFTD